MMTSHAFLAPSQFNFGMTEKCQMISSFFAMSTVGQILFFQVIPLSKQLSLIKVDF